ncbi:peptidoglycan-binding domain-containing protein [Brachybacterium squillarum]|uniref:peptidoglycan-binding domain-containing protein n=1 Tax=Brachybacterium squillarum TaxID=661979 RepID=UPI002223D42C|nr:peptidoglycan-binding protein [Brachybacterium squillarum]MCW1803884.1 peptidoglycan-binding protein [Brachybacterium squillarum]
MKDFTTARADYIAWCRDQLGEAPWEVPAGSNRNDYSRALGRPAQAWCVDFAQAGLEATGSGGGIIPTASTRAHIAWAKTVGRHRSRTRPALGALVAVAKNGVSVHTDGCVVKASTSRLLAIGGNTSNRGGSTADGGGVYLNDRTYMLGSGTYRIYGYTLPFFGLTREDVLEIQGKLGVTRTGYMTAATVAAVKAFQKRSGLTADGFPGPTTFSALTLGTGGDASAAAPLTPAGGDFADVDRTQAWLNELGYGPLSGGVYDTATAAAVLAAQQDLGITPADGRPGPATRTHLEEAVAKLDDIQKQLDAQSATLKEIAGAVLNGKSGVRSDGTLVKLAKDQHKEVLGIIAPGKAGVRTDGSLVEVIKTEARKSGE